MGRTILSWHAGRWNEAIDTGSDSLGYSNGPDRLNQVVYRDCSGATLGNITWKALERLLVSTKSRQVLHVILPMQKPGEQDRLSTDQGSQCDPYSEAMSQNTWEITGKNARSSEGGIPFPVGNPLEYASSSPADAAAGIYM